ncbi:Electron transport complex subunit RnfG [bioreactor metagenome]|uniref:Electron transport complex subunit RnfG n=1 Tax=bioreactor metagenome TaxID=1076179 RepID=A0A644YBF2_9ZZZZ
MSEKKKNPDSIPRLTLILLAFAAVTALVLGLVNMITKDKIALIKEEKTSTAMQAVLPADSYSKVDYSGGDTLVLTVYSAGDKGYVVEVGPSGFGGTIDMVVGVDTDGAVTGVSIISMSETSGLGSNATKEAFRSQYVGGTGPFAVNKDGGKINALTGATVTSRAVTKGVNAALDAVKTLG